MATVYEAVVGNRRVALKRPRADVLERRPDMRALFEREYQTLAQLAHPNIIEVYGYGIDQEGPYYTMELLEGGELGERLPMPWKQACQVLRDVTAALAMVHSRRMVHRDVSLHNVRLAANGTAKLIDFGAMTPMGVPERTIGTPPYMPPEAVYHQALDSRTDLYAVGALGYRLLTGRDAYPAQRIEELRDAWRTRPRPLTDFDGDIPEALDELIRQLLSLGPDGRCRTTAEVFVRLSSVAGLRDVDDAEIARAYLTTPTLVGRDEELMVLRRRIVQAIGGRGSAVLVEGPTGIGRSRLLNACILDAQLAGAQAVRASAVARAGSAFELIARLGKQLVETRPEHAPRHPGVKALLGQCGDDAEHSRDAAEDTGALQQALVSWLLEASSRPLLLVVDDLQLADLDSAAVLAHLVDVASERRLTVIASVSSAGSSLCGQALRVVRSKATTLQLQPLTPAQTLELVRSLFGDVSNVQLVAQRVHEVARGNPRATVELAEWLVERGHVVHRGGRWLLPDALSSLPLPCSVEEALRQRVAQLSPRAVELGAAIALGYDADLPTSQYVALLEQADGRAAYAALAELLGANVILPHGRGHALAQHAFGELLLERVEPPLRAVVRRRIAHVCLDDEQLDWGIYHLFYGDERDKAVDLLLSRVRQGHSPAHVLRTLEEGVAFLRDVLCHCREQGRPAAEVFELHNELARRAEIHISLVRDEIGALSQRYKDLVGYTDWLALPEDMEPSQRLRAAMDAAQARQRALPEKERLMGPLEALPKMVQFVGSCLGSAAANTEMALLEQMPPLAPFAPLSEAIHIMERYVEAVKATIAGRAEAAGAIFVEALELLDGEAVAKLGPMVYRLRRHALVAIGMLDAGLSRSSALDYADRLDSCAADHADPYAKLTALRVRHAYHLRRGNWRQAEHWEHQMELEKLKDRGAVYNPSGIYALSWIHATVGNVPGMHDCLMQMQEHRDKSEGLAIWERYMAAEYDRLRGASERALPVYRAILDNQAGRHLAWLYAAQGALFALEELDRLEEARRLGHELLRRAIELRIGATRGLITRPLSLVEARVGRFPQAVALISDCIERSRRLGMGGLNLGIAYEIRARIAILANDSDAFEAYTELCADQYLAGGGSPELTARLDALLDVARRAGVARSSWRVRRPAPLALSHAQVELRDRLADCATSQGRCRQALLAFTRAAGANGGHFFGVTDDRLRLLASHGRNPHCPEAWAVAARYLGGAGEHAKRGETLTRTGEGTVTQSGASATRSTGTGDTSENPSDGTGLNAQLVHEPGQPIPVAVFVLPRCASPGRWSARELIDVIALALTTAGDIRSTPFTDAPRLPGLFQAHMPISTMPTQTVPPRA